MTDCLFCKIAAGEIPAEIVFEDNDLMAFRDIAPVAPQHILIIPKKHIDGPASITAEDEGLIGKMMRMAGDVAADNGIGNAYRLVLSNGKDAGQLIFHIHMHIIGGRPLHWPPG